MSKSVRKGGIHINYATVEFFNKVPGKRVSTQKFLVQELIHVQSSASISEISVNFTKNFRGAKSL